MALKFLNKKGWHTGSLRNIENVWKAEQKHEAEQRKLEELRKQIHEERERSEFRQLQEQAGLIPRQERLDFLYESGLAVGKGSSSFKELESLPKTDPETAASSSASAAAAKQPAAPGALFEDKPQSANDAWRKLHSDPLLLIRQREQEALARVKNNPIQMAMIRKSVESKKEKSEKKHGTKKHKRKSKHNKYSSSENDSGSEGATMAVERDSRHRGSRSEKSSHKAAQYSDEELSEGHGRRDKYYDEDYKGRRPTGLPYSKYDKNNGDRHSKKDNDSDSEGAAMIMEKQRESHQRDSRSDKPSRSAVRNSDEEPGEGDPQRKKYYDKDYKDRRHSGITYPKYDRSKDDQVSKKSHDSRRKEYSSEHHERPVEFRHANSSDKPPRNESNNRHRNPVKLSEEERAARLREMQMDAERHEQQRWKRLKKAAESEAQEAVKDHASSGKNFLDAAQKSVYGAEKGGSSTIEESVRRRTHYLQGRSASDSNAFRR